MRTKHILRCNRPIHCKCKKKASVKFIQATCYWSAPGLCHFFYSHSPVRLRTDAIEAGEMTHVINANYTTVVLIGNWHLRCK